MSSMGPPHQDHAVFYVMRQAGNKTFTLSVCQVVQGCLLVTGALDCMLAVIFDRLDWHELQVMQSW